MRNKKIKKCAEWLAYCLDIGWSKNDLDGLQELWMANHDDNGNYKAQLQQHSVMQAEGSDVSEGAAVGQRSVGTNAEGVAFNCVSSESLVYNRPCKEWCGNPYCKSEAPSGGHL